MSLSKKAHAIKNRKNSNDVFITPLELALLHINLIDYNINDVWLDPFRNSGSYYNQFPTDNKKWCEILDNKDFYDFNEKIDIICSNPPYSEINKIINHSIKLNPRVISFLIGIHNLTPKRIEILNNAGYGLYKIHMIKIYKWFGFSVIVVFEKNKKNCINYGRKIYR
jgi:hypothetical protein